MLFGRPPAVHVRRATSCIFAPYGRGVSDVLVMVGALGLGARLRLEDILILPQRAQAGAGSHRRGF